MTVGYIRIISERGVGGAGDGGAAAKRLELCILR